MKEFFIALALAAFAVAGTAPAFAQSSGTWSAGISTRNGLPFVHAPSTRNNGQNAFAQVPATGHQRATDYYNMVPSSLGPADRFGGRFVGDGDAADDRWMEACHV